MSLIKRSIAEFIGTFWLVLGGCGSAVIAAAYTELNTQAQAENTNNAATQIASTSLGIGTFGVAIAFGLTVLTIAYAIGHISGCHLNPAVSFGLWAAKRFPGRELLPYIVAQVLGAIGATILIYLIASGQSNYSLSGTNPLASNGFLDHSPQGYSLLACLITEIVMTFFFLMVILGSTDKRAPNSFAPIAIGLALTLIHLISIPVTNTSVNPARSTGPALIVALLGKPELLSQLWLFWLAPIVGAIVAGIIYLTVFEESRRDMVEEIAEPIAH
jgi:aquaporin Z